jgi:hypothetical protein
MKITLKKITAMNYKLFLTILISLFFSEFISGQSFNEKRIIHKSLPANKEMTLEVNNKYGTIHITPWKKDSVSIRAEIEAFASDLDRLHNMLNGIEVNISETSFMVRAETEFTQNIYILFEEFKGITKNMIPYNSKIQINYFIDAPEYLDMRITNKYGDVYTENNTGTFTLNLSNGSFKANSLNETDGIDLTFCDATINKMNGGFINTSFSEVVIGESKDLSITSISSRFDLKKTGKLDTRSKRDKFFIGTITSLKGNSYFTDFRIEELDKEINMVTKYGSLRIGLLTPDIELVTINTGYSDIDLTFDPSVSYNLDIRHLNTFLVLPEKNSKLEKKTLNEEDKEFMTYGTVGKNPGDVKVKIDATRGNIYLK